MKKAIVVGFLFLLTQLTPKDAQAVEDEEFWACVVAVSVFDLSALASNLACRIAAANPNQITVGGCLIAVGFSGTSAAAVWLACDDELVETCEQGPGTEETASECSDDTGSPILLDLDRNGYHLSGGPVIFDIDSDGQPEIITWVAPNNQDGFLYLDLNDNGVVDNGLELFGDAMLLTNLDLADNGYQALAEFDLRENGGFEDGKIDSLDSVFGDLRVWVDENADGLCDLEETMSLDEAGVLSLAVNYRESPRVDSFGNEFRYVSRGLIDVDGRPKKMWTTDVFFKVLADERSSRQLARRPDHRHDQLWTKPHNSLDTVLSPTP